MILIRYDHRDNTFEYFCCTQGEAEFTFTQIQMLNAKFLESDSYCEYSTKYGVNDDGEYESRGWILSDFITVLKIISTIKDFDFSVELKELN